MSSDEPTEFTTRFRLTRADTRAALWFGARDWVGWLLGVAVLTVVCATWPALGKYGRVAAIVFPVLTALKLLSLLNRSQKDADEYCDQELVLSLNREGIVLDAGLTKSVVQWQAIRRIVRGGSVWLFYLSGDERFFVPTAAISVEARALVARWAGEAGAQLS